MSITGIDVHGAKGPVVWRLVQMSGRKFALVKSSEGVGFLDPLYQQNVSGAKHAGLPVSPYHFARPDLHPPDAEAHAFHQAIVGTGYTSPPALDFERRPHGKTPAQLRAWAIGFLHEMRALGHDEVAFYTYPDYWRTDMGNPPAASIFTPGVLGWWAEYGPVAHIPPGWPTWLWQFSSSGHVPGVGGLCDQSVFDGTLAEYLASFTPRRFGPPWAVFAGGKQIGAGRLIDRALVVRIHAALEAAGHHPPYTARLEDGTRIATGRFWLPGLFTRTIARRLLAGQDVIVDNLVTIRTHRV